MQTPNITSQEFVSNFAFDAKEKNDLVLFSDPKEIGFSIKKEYSNNILFKPAKNANWKDDSIALIHVVYRYKDEVNGKVPVYVRIAMASRYLLDNHYDYNFDDKESPTKNSLEISTKSVQPAELASYWDYFYDINREEFLEKHNIINPKKIIDDIYQKHIKTAHKFSWIPFRSKMWAKNFIVNFAWIWIIIFKWMLKKWFWRDLQRKWGDDFLSGLGLETYRKEDLLPTIPNKISILWFETNITKQSFITLCLLLVVCYVSNVYRLNIYFERAQVLFGNQIFIWALAILLIHFFDSRMPFIFFWIINGLIRLKLKFMFMKIKI